MTEIPKEISFCSNWNNKLNCDAFTSIRLRNDKKYHVGEDYVIIKGKEPIYMAKLIQVIHFHLSNLTPAMAYLDTGYSPKETQQIIEKMYKNKNINVYEIEFSWLLFYHKSVPNHLPQTDTSEYSDTSY